MLNPIANLISFVLKSADYYEGNAGVMAFVLSSVDGCKAFTTRVLPEAAKQLALKFYADLTD
ncbi:hypothetical protein F2Q69_00002483 [Brassica cretica]|uniref:Uncharacterized protein n=2 Tax=Brassica cretica TaxID=69181 RepID=A0ABQ7BV69_BRACR|nr:hypothetical protein F2Q69_00002483 [Brassica cretica]KAF3543389.1 hypothetical protein DY000_02002776 [Brassica cretica]